MPPHVARGFPQAGWVLAQGPGPGRAPRSGAVLKMLVRLGGLGPIVGTGIGWVATTLLGYVLNDPLNEIVITVRASRRGRLFGNAPTRRARR